jgi:beta-phosphoglucomutase
MKIKAVIFDLDGVICHTDQFHYQAWKALADQYGIYFDEKINNRLRGVSRMASLDIILERYEGDRSLLPREEMAEQKNRTYRNLLEQMTPADVAPEVLETLEKLKKAGIKIAIGSSSKNTPLILEKIGLSQEFDAVSDGNNITKSKPDPEVFLKAAELLNVPPPECMIVEDAEAGILAGKNGKMTTIGIGEAASCGEADFSVTDFGMIYNIVSKLQ